MRVRSYIYNAAVAEDHVETVLDRLAERDEPVELLDVAAADDTDGARREAMLTLRESIRIGENPGGIYDDAGRPDFATGVLITESATGRRSIHVGREALDSLDDADGEA